MNKLLVGLGFFNLILFFNVHLCINLFWIKNDNIGKGVPGLYKGKTNHYDH